MFLPTNITLKFGDSGDFVTELQRRLSVIHCFNPDTINGFFDGNTANAVSQFQTQSGIRADGIAGPETLRRLNGVISGDHGGSTATNHQAEEEARQRQELANRLLIEQQMLADQQQRQAEIDRQLAVQPQVPIATAPAPEVQSAQPHASAATQAVYTQTAPQAYTQPIVAQPAAVAAAPSASDMLAQMLLAPQVVTQNQSPQSTTTSQPIPAQPALHQPIAASQAQPVVPQVAPLAYAQPTPLQAAATTAQPHLHPAAQSVVQPYAQPAPQTTQQQATVQAYAPAAAPQAQQTAPSASQPYGAAPAAEAAVRAPEQPRGLVGRAMQYANDVMQKISSYIESKLPQHTLNEVKEIGATLARSGVREVSMGAAQEQQQQRGVEGPGKSAGQAQQRS